MIENDEERRSRDKFVRERDYGGPDNRFPRRDFGGPDRFRRDYNGVGGIKRTVIRRDNDGEMKRGRFDGAIDSFEPSFVKKDESTTPVMHTFKKFLATQDESISDEEAISRYLDYKADFKKRECQRYFQEHKNEEWFRQKYHPEEFKPFKEFNKNAVNKRLEVFNKFLSGGMFGNLTLDYTKAEELIRMMDSVVVKLEDGSDDDLEMLKSEEIEDDSVIELKKANEETSNKESPEVKSRVKTEANQNGNHSENNNEISEDGIPEKRKTLLHKTCSIFFKNIPKNAKIADLENVCKQHPGFLRIGFTDPVPEANNRRGYVTYRRDVNIKEIFWNLRNIKLMDVDVGASVNRDLKRRIRTVSGLAAHRPIVQNDIRQVAKLIVLYDFKASLFLPDENLDGSLAETPFADLEGAIVKSKNPVFKNIVDYLVEEENAEEELLLGFSDKPEEIAKSPFEVDQKFISALDRLILYLRIVHSVDYYNSCEYANEDTMPHRMGILHVRGKFLTENYPDKTDSGVPLLNKTAVDEFVAGFNERLTASLFKNISPEESELEKLGKKDPQKAEEEFITTNCVEQGKDKWLCPLSGKKFKAPEFIHKHLHSKYQEQIDELKNEAMYFNNFLADSNRPRDYVDQKAPPPQSQQPTQTGSTTSLMSQQSVVLRPLAASGGGNEATQTHNTFNPPPAAENFERQRLSLFNLYNFENCSKN